MLDAQIKLVASRNLAGEPSRVTISDLLPRPKPWWTAEWTAPTAAPVILIRYMAVLLSFGIADAKY